jgi:hypothetical protein
MGVWAYGRMGVWSQIPRRSAGPCVSYGKASCLRLQTGSLARDAEVGDSMVEKAGRSV